MLFVAVFFVCSIDGVYLYFYVLVVLCWISFVLTAMCLCKYGATNIIKMLREKKEFL